MNKCEKKLFPTQESSEKVFILIRKHWFAYALFFFLALIFVIPLIALIIYWSYNPVVFSGFAGNIAVICSSIYFLVILGIEFYGFIDFYLDVDIVTDRRIVDITQGGLFKRSIAELHLREVQDVHAKVHGFFPTMLNYGDVVIQTAGERANFIFSSVPDPYSVAKRIIDLHEHQIQIIDGSEDGTNCDHLTEKRGEGKFNFRAGSESEHLVRTTLSESNNVLHVGHKNLNQLRNGESNSGELSAGKEVNL